MKFGLQKALIVSFVVLTLGSFFSPLKSNRVSSSVGHAAGQETETVVPQTASAAVPTLAAVENYLNRLFSRGCPPSAQAILIQTLDGQILAEHNADVPLNPASVMKLSTSYLALKHFGPEYKFKTTAYTTGKINESQRTLFGDLIIESEGDPSFTPADAAELAQSVRSQGIQRVEGRLLIQGPFRFQCRSSLEYAYSKMRSALGLSFPKVAEQVGDSTAESATERIVLGVHESKPLRDLLLFMNAHSNNFYAEQLGDALGGPDAVRAALIKEFDIRPSSLYISHTSGLDYNRITPRTSVTIFRHMISLLKEHQMRIEDIMPVAGVDSGTLMTRFRQPGVQGSIVAKTGTLNSTDNGVSALQGVIYSERYGPLLFAIFNMGGGVHYFRQNQDRFLIEAIAEMGTPLQTIRTENILAPRQQIQLAEDEAPTMSRFQVRRVSQRSRHVRAYRNRRS